MKALLKTLRLVWPQRKKKPPDLTSPVDAIVRLLKKDDREGRRKP